METPNGFIQRLSIRFCLCFLAALCAAGFPLYAQNEAGVSRTTGAGNESVINQVITFPEVSGTLYYEVEIEQRAGTRFVPVETRETAVNSITTTLRVGDYRYRITSYNRMGLPEGQSEWRYFDVIPVPVTPPSIASTEPEPSKPEPEKKPLALERYLNFTVSAGYSPMFALFDIDHAWMEYGENPSERIKQLNRFNAAGFYTRFGFIPFETTFGNFGVEANVFWLFDKHDQKQWGGGSPGIVELFSPFTINLLYQLPITEQLQHNARLGLGGGNSYHMDTIIDDYSSAGKSLGFMLYIDIGYSTQFFVWKDLYVEAGIDLLMARGFDGKHNHFMIRPAIGAGWQFGR